jgi:hypothetical protein
VISAILETTLKRLQFFIAEFSEAALERARIIAAIKNRGTGARPGNPYFVRYLVGPDEVLEA